MENWQDILRKRREAERQKRYTQIPKPERHDFKKSDFEKDQETKERMIREAGIRLTELGVADLLVSLNENVWGGFGEIRPIWGNVRNHERLWHYEQNKDADIYIVEDGENVWTVDEFSGLRLGYSYRNPNNLFSRTYTDAFILPRSVHSIEMKGLVIISGENGYPGFNNRGTTNYLYNGANFATDSLEIKDDMYGEIQYILAKQTERRVEKGLLPQDIQRREATKVPNTEIQRYQPKTFWEKVVDIWSRGTF